MQFKENEEEINAFRRHIEAQEQLNGVYDDDNDDGTLESTIDGSI